MEAKNYTVSRTEGEYAYLRDEATGEEVFFALALLPDGIDVGDRLRYEALSFTKL